MMTFLFVVVTFLPPLLSIACFVWAMLHGNSRLARWYRADMRHRAYWLAFCLAISRYVMLAPLYLYVWKKNDSGWSYLLLFTMMPERGGMIALDYVFGLPPGVYSEGDLGHFLAACLIIIVALYFLWFWCLNHVNQSLSRYDWP